jgi:HlyD family secretion protein
MNLKQIYSNLVAAPGKSLRNQGLLDPASGRPTRRFYLYLLALVTLVSLTYLALAPAPVPVETAPVVRGAFEEFLTEDAATRVREKFTVLAPVSGVLQRLRIHPGDAIQNGQTVATILWDWQRPVRAPAGGSVLRVFREDAGPIEMGTPILEIGDPNSLEIVVDLLTADAVRVVPGTRVRIDRWGGHSTLAGTVRLIEPAAFTKVSALGVEEQRVNALVDITSPRDLWRNLGDNFRVECTLILAESADALKVPAGAVFREGDDWMLFRINSSGQAEKLAIEIAGRNPTEIAVREIPVEGPSSADRDSRAPLQPEDLVIVYPGSQVRAGISVRGL